MQIGGRGNRMPSSSVLHGRDFACGIDAYWTGSGFDPIIHLMIQTVEQVVKDHLKAAKRLRRENRDPAKARAFLLRAGIAELCKSAPNGIRLARRYR